jgi:hypothetical protein
MDVAKCQVEATIRTNLMPTSLAQNEREDLDLFCICSDVAFKAFALIIMDYVSDPQ